MLLTCIFSCSNSVFYSMKERNCYFVNMNPLPHNLDFDDPGNQYFLLFPQCFFSQSRTNFIIWATFVLLSANSLKLDQAKIWSCGYICYSYRVIYVVCNYAFDFVTSKILLFSKGLTVNRMMKF